jgi:hypothetical protein
MPNPKTTILLIDCPDRKRIVAELGLAPNWRHNK